MSGSNDFDWLLLVVVSVLILVGLLFIYSAFHPHLDGEKPVHYDYVWKQIYWILAGSLALLVALNVRFRHFEALALLLYGILLILLIAVLFVPTRAQAHRWLPLGPVNLQPSEMGKIVLLFVWARILAGSRKGPEDKGTMFLVFCAFVPPFILVLKQPDLGTAMTYFALMLAVLYWRGLGGWKLFYIVSPLIACIVVLYGDVIGTGKPYSALPLGVYLVAIIAIAYYRRSDRAGAAYLLVSTIGVGLTIRRLWTHLMPYQQERIKNFLDPGSDKLSAGWQVFQSKIAIGSGGVAGKGFLFGTQKSLAFIPARHTDFIFSIIGEELGFMGGIVILLLFFVLVWRAMRIAAKCNSDFASTVCFGIAAYFGFQVLLNIGMTTGIAPVTGIPLPFLSYGGSSMATSMFMIGFLLNCSKRWIEY